METSDSEYFESADEDIQSDEEDTKTVKSLTVKTEEKKDLTTQLENFNIKETHETVSSLDSNKNSKSRLEKDDENNANIRKREEVKKELEVEVDNIKSEEEVEENLWDDDEIDWSKPECKEDNLWNNDDEWEPIDPKPDLTKQEAPTWGSWGTWGVSSLLNTATQSVSTLTQNLTTVLESGIGVPDPEELARLNHADKEKLTELDSKLKDEERNTTFGLGNIVMGVSHLTKLVETTGTKVISGGLDTLETIGKKTMEVLQEGDPGLKKKRAFLKIDDKPVLSQLLREAKEKAEEENKILEKKHFVKKAKNYETLFDDHQGLVHLEALEMLSKQCDIKLQTLVESYTNESLRELQETMEQVKELCELPDEDEEEQNNGEQILDKLNSAVKDLNVQISYKKLIETWEKTEVWLNNLKLEICDENELHQQAVETLAQLTAIAVEQFHRTGELLLVKEHRSTADEADSLVQLTTSLTSLIGIVAARFTDKLNAKNEKLGNKEAVNGLITNVFFEAANSSSYIQDAFQLLVPVLQVGAV